MYVLSRHGPHFDVWRTCPELCRNIRARRSCVRPTDIEMFGIHFAVEDVDVRELVHLFWGFLRFAQCRGRVQIDSFLQLACRVEAHRQTL
jgi:hypothetical protein